MSLVAYIPPWLPGGKYKQQAAECRVIAEEVLTKPFQYVVDNMASIITFLYFGF